MVHIPESKGDHYTQGQSNSSFQTKYGGKAAKGRNIHKALAKTSLRKNVYKPAEVYDLNQSTVSSKHFIEVYQQLPINNFKGLQ
jgi:hypothetical protein